MPDEGRAAETPAGALPPQELAARAYFDYALSGILETDAKGRIGRANQAAARITGREPRALKNLGLDALLPVTGRAALDRHLQLLAEQGISHGEWDILRRDGEVVRIQLASVQVGDDHLLHVFDDVTAQRRAAAELEAARHAAEEANRAKSAFLANISHEVRTPLNGILGLARLALATELDARQRDYIEKIARSGDSLLRIINDLLDYAKFEAGAMEFERIEFPVAELIDELHAVAAARSPDPALEVVFHVAPDVPATLVGDRLRVAQCLANLLGNALKFTRQGRVSLELDVTARTADGVELDFVVADTGIGMSPETLARLFQPFSQADAATTRRFGGTGLGLAIAREFARGMGGELSVESEAGRGSRFTLHLPFGVAAARIAPPAPSAAFDDVPEEFRGLHVLVAEDNAVNQLVITDLLQLAGIRTTLAQDGREALELLADDALAPDLVLMDVHMPELDGLEATRRLRGAGFTRPIIGCSAGASKAETAACLDAGMNDVLPKPIDPDELWGVLTRWVPPRAAAPSPAPEDATARFRGNTDALQKARTIFVACHADDASRLREYLAADNRKALAELAHALHGSSATIGAMGVAEIARELESRGPADEAEELAPLIDALETALAAFVGEHRQAQG